MGGGLLNNNPSKKYLIIIGITLTIITIIGISYAFISTTGKQDIANTIISGCLNVKIETEGTAINESGISPITDVEGLKKQGYNFTIKNTCDKETNYEINLESLTTDNKIDPKYIRVALSSNTNDNIIVNLNENNSNKRQATIDGAYESYNLYKGTISGNTSKEFTIKEWMDYDTTKEQGANKTYQSKINVIANPELETTKQAEIKFTQEGTEVTGTIEGEITNIKYCTTTDNECEPQDEITNENKTIKPELEANEKEQIVCVKINNEETICSNPMTITLPLLNKEIIAQSTGQTISSFTGPACGTCDIDDENGIYETEDNDGISYYFRGTVSNNWVKFGENDAGTQDVWWRIIRINGDGTIRLIYSGMFDKNEKPTNGMHETGANTIVSSGQTYSVDGAENDNTYVGFYTGSTGGNTFDNTHSNTTPSNVATQLKNWYDGANWNADKYAQYIDENAGFCNDRTIHPTHDTWWTSEGDNYRGTGTVKTAYGPFSRINTTTGGWNTIQTPTLICGKKPDGEGNQVDNDAYKRDLFTPKSASKGNGKLEVPVGLITADEVVFAGGFGGQQNNTDYYLYNDQNFWTMSPQYFSYGYATVFMVHIFGRLSYSTVSYATPGVRPVINLKANTTFKTNGNENKGTIDNPYIVGE